MANSPDRSPVLIWYNKQYGQNKLQPDRGPSEWSPEKLVSSAGKKESIIRGKKPYLEHSE